MSASGRPARAAKPNLRTVQKALTRTLIRDAARDLFHAQGYHGTTIDQIVAAAGASRQTFYLHFSDKEDVLSEIIADYLPKAVAEMEKLPGPAPSMPQIMAWMTDWTQFVLRERASIIAITEFGATAVVRPPALLLTLDALNEALARHIPAFAAAQKDDAIGLEARARSELLMAGMTWAARVAIQNVGTPYAETVIRVIANTVFDFVHDKRFADTPLR